MAAVSSETKAILDALKEVKDQQQKTDPVIKAMLEAAKVPASKAGVTPEEYWARSLAANPQQASIVGPGAQSLAQYHPDAPLHGFKKCIGSKPGEFGEFLHGVFHDMMPGGDKNFAKKTLERFGTKAYTGGQVIKAALAESSGTTGGYTVPPQFATNIMELMVEESILEPRCNVIPMTSATYQYPSVDYTTVRPVGSSPFLAGITAYWGPEAALRKESEPTFRQIELKSNELSFFAVASNTVIADSVISIEGLLTKLFSQAIPWYLEYAYLQGTGAGQPLGVLQSPALITVTRNTTVTVKWADVANMLAKMVRLNPRASLVWMIQNTVIPSLLTMVDGGGRPVFTPLDMSVVPGIKGEGPQAFGMMYGHPVFITEKLPKVGTTGDILLIDAGLYLVGKRQEIEIQVSPHVYFLNNQMVWRIIYRGDGQPELNSFITLQDGVTTLSPFVCLSTL
jgi:HK97 family phage major capsid protein